MSRRRRSTASGSNGDARLAAADTRTPETAEPGTGITMAESEEGDVSVPVLDELIELRRRQKQVEEFQDRAAEMKSRVDPAVYERVTKDYAARHEALGRQAAPLKVQARQEYARLLAVYGEIESRHRDARLAKEELEFRHALGELTDEELADRVRQPEDAIRECEAEQARCDRQRARFQEALTEEELSQVSPAASETPAGQPPQAETPAPPPPPPSVTLAGPPPVPAPADDATFLGPLEDLLAASAVSEPAFDDRTIIAPAESLPSGDVEDPTHRAPLPVDALLVLEEPNVPRIEFPLGSVDQIGRSEDNQVRLVRPGVSRHHAVVRRDGDAFVLQDLNSQNGTFLNGTRIQEEVLKDGDRIWVGDVELVFTVPASH